jgi:colicin import membrane protein
MPSAFLTLRSFVLSLLLHGAAAVLLVLSFDFTPKVEPVAAVPINIVEAVKVDAAQVEAEVERLREADRKREEERRKLEKQVADMEKKAAAAEKQRKAEEQKLVELQKKAREAEEKKLAEAKKQQEELDKKRKLEEEKKRKAAEEALRKQVEAEQRALEAQQLKENQRLIAEFSRRIQVAVQQNFNLTGVPPGLSCKLQIRTLPGGEVVSAQVSTSSGDEVFDRRALDAVSKASPLPVPDDPKLYEAQFRNFILNFSPSNP